MAMVSSYWRLKLIESTLKNKSPKRYKELKKTGQLEQFLNEIDKQIMDIYENKRKNAFSKIKKQQTDDDPQILQKLQQADKKAWTNTLYQFMISPDFETKEKSLDTNKYKKKHKIDLHTSDSRPLNNLRSQLAEWHSLIVKEALAGKHVPQRPPDWQPPTNDIEREAESIKNITPTQKKELTPEEQYEKVSNVLTNAFRKFLKIKYPHLLKVEGRQPNTVLDPEILTTAIDLAGFHIEGGARSFMDFSKNMIADIGEVIRPYLKSLYIAVRNYPGIDKTGMNTEEEIDAIN